MNILLTGSKGQLGNELLKCFSAGKSELGKLPEELKNANVCGVDIDTLDISDFTAVKRFFSENKFDAVINCAAYTNVDACEENKDLAFKANAIGPRNLAIACEKTGAKFIHVSTDYVFSGNGVVPYIEWDICSPHSIYGSSKLLGERYVKEFCGRYFIVRTSWLYGYTGGNFVKTIIKLARKNGKVKVVNDQRGNPTNAADLAHHILTLLPTEEYGIYHGTGNGECTWFDFAKKIVEYKKINAIIEPCTTEEFPRPAKRPAFSSLDNMMFRNTTGDNFRHWEEALKYFIENYEEN